MTTERRKIADAARVEFHPDGSRTIWWQDGISRTYSQKTVAAMFLDAVERGHSTPVLDRLTRPEERRLMYRILEEMTDEMADAVAQGDTTLGGMNG